MLERARRANAWAWCDRHPGDALFLFLFYRLQDTACSVGSTVQARSALGVVRRAPELARALDPCRLT
jgi:hypothetical protein